MLIRSSFYSLLFLVLPFQAIQAGDLKNLYKTTEPSNCNLENATHIGTEKLAKYRKIKEVRYCIISDEIKKINIYKGRSDEKPETSVRKIAKLGESVQIRGTFSSTGRQLSPDKKRQYELEDNNLVIYECIKKECKKNIITKKVIAKPIDQSINQ